MSLRFTCKRFHSIIILNFCERFVEGLVQYKVVPTKELAIEFCDNLWNSGAYVAGGFILSVLYESNDHKDIDVYDMVNPESTTPNDRITYEIMDKSNYLNFTKSIPTMGFIWSKSNIVTGITIREYIHKKFGSKPKKSYIKKGRYFDPLDNSTILQVIPIALEKKKSSIPKFILATFDLDICMSGFDGRNLYVRSWDKLIYKKDYIKPNTKFMLNFYMMDNFLTMTHVPKREEINI